MRLMNVARPHRSGGHAALVLIALCALALAAPGAAQAAAPAPAWSLTLTPIPANAAPGGKTEFYAVATNVGGAAAAGTSTLEVTLPAGIAPTGYEAINRDPAAGENPTCSISSQTLHCQTEKSVRPGFLLVAALAADVSVPEGTYQATATVAGGGAAAATQATASLAVAGAPLPFQIMPGFGAPVSEPDGSPTALAAAHPYQQTIDFGFPTKKPGSFPTGSGHPRDFTVQLAPGMIGDPAATPLLCTEAQLALDNCPAESQLGVVGTTTLIVGKLPTVFLNSLYNMVPSPGTPALLGTDVADVGLLAHVQTGLRSESDYGVEASLHDLLALPGYPIFDIQTQLWGDPSGSAHDGMRGDSCIQRSEACGSVTRQHTPFLTVPGDCPGHPTTTEVSADDWEQPGLFQQASYENADLQGNPVSLAGCNQLAFQPTISARPTTNLPDSPSGLEVDLHQPQQAPVGAGEDPLSGRATAELKDARVTLPAGMAVNPSQAAGRGVCTEAQIGYLGEGHYSKAPQSCPDDAKLGSLEVSSPLLAQTEAQGTKIAKDPETGAAIPRPLHGSVYLAKPYQNQFGSLLAIYLAVEDPTLGHRRQARRAGRTDPKTGQLTTVFEENPELPLSDIHLSLFGGARGALITPLTCGAHATTTTLTPWSDERRPDRRQPTRTRETPSRPPAPARQRSRRRPTHPPSRAGTLAPQAGAYQPFVLKLHREDGSQRLTRDRHHPAAGPYRQAGRDRHLHRCPAGGGPLPRSPQPRHRRDRPPELPCVL